MPFRYGGIFNYHFNAKELFENRLRIDRVIAVSLVSSYFGIQCTFVMECGTHTDKSVISSQTVEASY